MTMNVVRPARTSVARVVCRSVNPNHRSREAAAMRAAAVYHRRALLSRRGFCAVLVFFRGGGIDDVLDLGDLVRREAALLRVLAHHVLVRGDVYAVDLVARHVALHPLDLRTETLQDAAGLL